MKWKDFKDDEVAKGKFLEIFNNGETYEKRNDKLRVEFEIAERTVRKWAEKLGLSKPQVEKESEDLKVAKEKVVKLKDVYLITWAQNNTPLHGKLFDGIEAYAKERDAEIVVVAGKYGNPTSLRQSKAQDEKKKKGVISWDKRLKPYLSANEHTIHDLVKVMADVPISPTATNPLSGLEGLSGLESCIVGHPQMSLRSLGILDNMPNKLLLSTGAVTKKNYTSSKAGKKGEFDHTLGFLVIEILDDKRFIARNVMANTITGEFNDLVYNVKGGVVSKTNSSIDVASMGDIHIGSTDVKAFNAAVGLLKILEPKHIILPDVFDARSISHHHEKSPFFQVKKHDKGYNELKSELDMNEEFIRDMSKEFPNSKIVIQPSNHNDHVEQYMNRVDWKKDYANARTFFRLAELMTDGGEGGLFAKYVDSLKIPNVICPHRNDSYAINGIEYNIHGDMGSGGSRGSTTQFRKLPVKTTTNHTHTPFINGGNFVTGTLTKLRLSYNLGLNPWMHGLVIQDSMGKRQQVLIIDGNFTNMNL